MRLGARDKNHHLRLILLLLCVCGDVSPSNPYKSGEVRADYPKGCAYLKCKRGDQCVNRKFWCRNPPCPSMLYCSKSRKESLKGPSSCEAVRCSKGFVCLVRVRRCRWNEPCEQQIARCVSERDYYDGPASCADFKCPSGLRCMLRESRCAKPPCKLVKSCANPKDVKAWHEICRSLGCPSEHECFLRRPSTECPRQTCKHTPDCSAGSEAEPEANEQCRGWVCPKGEECSAHTRGPCKGDSCKISRSCHKPLMVPLNVTPGPIHTWRDDVKLSFFSRLDENSFADKITRGRVTADGKAEAVGHLAVGKFHENTGRKATIHESPNSRSSPRPAASTDIISGRVDQPTVTSLSAWLDHLRIKTGVDAVEAWIKKAEKPENYGAFLAWLDSVKDMLGPTAYDLWLEEVRTMTVTRETFQKWLPHPTSNPTVSPDFVEPSENPGDVNHRKAEVSPESRKSTDNKKNYSDQGLTDSGAEKTGTTMKDDHKKKIYVFPPNNYTFSMKPAIKVDGYKEESDILPPKNDTTSVEPEITKKNPIAEYNAKNPVSEIPTSQPSLGTDEWRLFYNPASRVQLIQPIYPLQRNFGNFLPWVYQAPQFAGFDSVDPRNSWYQQFQQTPDVDPHSLNPNSWLSQLSTLMNPQRNGISMSRRYLESVNLWDQLYRTNWSNANLNYFYPSTWADQPVPRQRDDSSVDRSPVEPGKGAAQLFPSDWSLQQPHDTNGQFPQPNNWQRQFGPSSNPQQVQTDQKYPEPEKFQAHQFQTNWTFQQPPNGEPNSLRPSAWQGNSLPPPNAEWQLDRDTRDQLDRRTLEAPKLPDENRPRANAEPGEYYSDNSTSVDTSWIKYFLDQTSRLYTPRENKIGSFPMDGENVGYESWPGTNDQGRRSADVPHRRIKHEGSKRDVGQFGLGDPRRPGEIAHELVRDSGLVGGFPWPIDPRLQDYYLHPRDQDWRRFYENYYREAPKASPGPSRTQRVDVDTRSPGPNPLLDDGRRDAPRLQYQWPDFYLQDRPYGITGLGRSSTILDPPRSTIATRAYDGPLDPFPKVSQPEVIGNGKFGFVYRDGEFDTSGQSMGVADLWNAKFRTPMSSVLRNVDEDKRNWGYRDVVEKKRLTSTTTSPPVISTLDTVAPHLVVAITSKDSQMENDDNQEGKDVENYDDDDDGIYPLLLSLQGYIEPSKEEGPEDPAVASKNLTILPVYRIEDDADDYSDDYDSSKDDAADIPASFEDEGINLFKNANYGGTPVFPNNLKKVFDVEAAMVMENTTGENGVEIKDVRWVYDDDEEDTLGPSSFFVQSQDSLPSSRQPSNVQLVRDWTGSGAEARNVDAENDYHDVGVDYTDKIITGDWIDRSFQPANNGDSVDLVGAPDDLVDSFDNDDPDHRRFKKNRP